MALSALLQAVSDPIFQGGYRHLHTSAWWLGAEIRPGQAAQAALVEHLIDTWVPFDDELDWLQHHRVSGRQEVFSEQYELDPAKLWPLGEWAAKFGDFNSARTGEPARPFGERKDPCAVAGSAAENLDATTFRDQLKSVGSNRQSTAPGRDVFREVGSMLATCLLPATHRRIAYSVLAGLDGVQLAYPGRDVSRGHVYEFALADDVRDHSLYINASDGQFAGEATSLIGGDDELSIPAGAIVSRSYTQVNFVQEF